MPDYSNNTNYLFWSDNLPYDQVYVGHTTTTLKKRLERHERQMDCVARRIIEAGSYHIRALERWPCETREQALWRERWWIEITPCINERIPIRTSEEHREHNRELSKDWRENNREESRKRSRVSRNKHLEKRQKEFRDWRSENIDAQRERERNYARKPDVKKRRQTYNAQKIECMMCGICLSQNGKARHASRCYTRFCKAFDIDADFEGIQGGVASE